MPIAKCSYEEYMKQIVVISGKGGTGKTVITASLAALSKNKVMADCDVDAADLHLLLEPKIQHRQEFRSGSTASIDQEKCIKCGKCRDVCRFSAVKVWSSDKQEAILGEKDADCKFEIDSVSCEGCAFCHFACPSGAIEMVENISGEYFVSDTRFGSMVHAKLGVAEENSGKLVSLVRNEAKKLAEEQKCDWIIIDGSPGIGCPVIASLSGVDCALVVTEPTLSGLHDASRVIEVAKHFGILTKVIINKYDLNLEMTSKIESFCKDKKISVLGKISFDKAVVNAMVAGKTIIEYEDGKTKNEIIKIWENIKKEISEKDAKS